MVLTQELCRAVSTLAEEVLCEGGLFLCKALQGTHTQSERADVCDSAGLTVLDLQDLWPP